MNINTGQGASLVLESLADTSQGEDEIAATTLAERLRHQLEQLIITAELRPGTRLGLSVAHGIVQSHGGLLQACSQQGKGSTFTVYLLVLDGDAEVSYPELDKQTRAISMPTKRGVMVTGAHGPTDRMGVHTFQCIG